MPKTNLTPRQELEIVKDYTENNLGIYPICEKYHVGKIKVKQILEKYEISLNNKGKQPLNIEYKVKDFKEKKYNNTDNIINIVYDENTDFESKDIDNDGGVLTTYINKQYGIKIPTLYDRRKYYMTTGNYWWEQWLKVKQVEKSKTKKCPYCNWETIDIENKSGAFEQHLLKQHNINKVDYLTTFSSEKDYFIGANSMKNLQLEENENKFVICQICGQKLKRINNHHLSLHNITTEEYTMRYGNKRFSNDYLNTLQKQSQHMNLMLEDRTDIFTSKAETEIKNYIINNGIHCHKNRSILGGKELDIFIPSKNIAIEYNGNKWHTEYFGKKNKYYHLNKLNECNNKGVRLIQIFEDEFEMNKDIVLNKLAHIIGININKSKINGRNITVHEIYKHEAEDFLNKNHIQGFTSSTVYLGGFYNNELIAVMTFIIRKNNDWELNRYASDNKYICRGAGGKLFNFFIKKYSYNAIISFADRRWTIDPNNNLYTKIGFQLQEFTKPSYYYYNENIHRYKRFHKFTLRKKTLLKNNPLLNSNLTELEMMRELGYDRIWDCGLIKYVYTNPNYKENGEE